MTAPLSLIRLCPNMAALTRWALERRYLPRHGDADFGYGLHSALKEALGDLAPRPFVLRQHLRRSASVGGADEVLGYVRATPEAIADVAALPPKNAAGSALNLASMEARPMPGQWQAGARFSFEIRVRPVVRSRRSGRNGPAHEVDVAAWCAQRVEEASGTPPTREHVYQEWLAERLDTCGAHLLRARVIAMRRTQVRRRPIIHAERRARDIEGPDVLFCGDLSVIDGLHFGTGIVRGVGRHTAFGFGCLLLAPPGARS